MLQLYPRTEISIYVQVLGSDGGEWDKLRMTSFAKTTLSQASCPPPLTQQPWRSSTPVSPCPTILPPFQ